MYNNQVRPSSSVGWHPNVYDGIIMTFDRTNSEWLGPYKLLVRDLIVSGALGIEPRPCTVEDLL